MQSKAQCINTSNIEKMNCVVPQAKNKSLVSCEIIVYFCYCFTAQ